MNEIPRNDRLFRYCQRTIIIRRAPTAEWAVESAKEQFASLEGIPNWKIHAALIEIEPIEIEPVEPEPKRNAKTLAPRI